MLRSRLIPIISRHALPALLSRFTAADGTSLAVYVPDSGPLFMIYGGAGVINSNKLESATDGTPLFAAANAGQTARCAAVDVTIPASGIYFGSGLSFGVVDANNGYLLLPTNDDGSNAFLTLAQYAGVM